MKVLFTSIGTRGDMEPFLALGELCKSRGDEVICLLPEQFRRLAEESGFRFASLGTEFIEMLDSEEGKTALGGSGTGLRKFMAYLRLAVRYRKLNLSLLERQYEVIQAEQPDRIVHNGKAIYPIIWSRERPGTTILVSPIPYLYHAVRDHSHVVFNRNLGPFLNKLSYDLANFGLIETVMKSVRMLKIPQKITRKQIRHALGSNKAIYTISPTIFSRPDYWPDHAQVLGYHERNKTLDWKPSPELLDFVGKHEKILLITFGSMTNPDPERKTRVFLEILDTHRIPAIINTAAGGLVRVAHPEHVLFVSQIPYDWILPKVHAMVHHGGSGTTHMALKYGCVSMIIPHIVDQFLWNDVLTRLEVGPRGMSITRLRHTPLESRLLDLCRNPAYLNRVAEIAARIANEDFRDEVYAAIRE